MSKFNLNRPDWSEEFSKKVFDAKRAQSLAYPPPPPPPPKPGNTGAQVKVGIHGCGVCGSAVWNDKVTEHAEWHETMTQAIREQVEEAVLQQLKDIQGLQKELAQAELQVAHDMFEKVMEKTSVLGTCPHGVNLDRAICQNGCRV